MEVFMQFLRVMLLFLSFALVTGCHPVDEKHVTAHELEYSVALDSPAEGAVRVEIAMHGIKDRKLTFCSKANPVEIMLFDLSVLDRNGAVVKNFPQAGKKIEVPVNPDGTVHLRYMARPGGIGRHGHQGYICLDFAVIDGRVFLEPEKPDSIKNVSLRISAPSGWQIVTPFEKKGDLYDLSSYGERMALTALQKSYIAFGQFSSSERRIGGTLMRVYAFQSWKSEYRRQITDKAFRLFSFFQKLFKSPPRAPYVICFIPRAGDGERIFGGVWSNGQCYEMPEDTGRNWELFAHRIAHVFNEYEPYGMEFRNIEDAWLLEAWAAFSEMSSTGGTGICDSDATWERLYATYLLKISQNPSVFDVPMARQYLIGSADVVEFVHYTKAPLAALLLDFRIRMASNSTKSLNGFMAFLYGRHGCHRGKIELAGELREYTGEDFSSFLDINIAMPGIMLPLWRIDAAEQENMPEGKVVCELSGKPVYESELYRYLRAYGKSLSELDEVKEMISRDRMIDEVFARDGIVFPPVITPSHVEMMDDRCWKFLMEKKREVFRCHLEADYYRKGSGRAEGQQSAIPVLEEWKSRLQAQRSAAPSKGEYVDSIYVGKGRDRSLILDECDVYPAGSRIEAVLTLKKRESHRLAILWKGPDGSKVRERKISTAKDWNASWDTLPAGKCKASGIWELQVSADGKPEASVSFLVVPGLSASLK